MKNFFFKSVILFSRCRSSLFEILKLDTLFAGKQAKHFQNFTDFFLQILCCYVVHISFGLNHLDYRHRISCDNQQLP